MRASEIRYRRLFEAARDGIFLLDAIALKITDANPFMTDLLGYSHDEFLGKELWEIGLFTDKKASKAAFNELQESGYLRYDDLPLKTKDGQVRQVEFVSNVYEEDGRSVIQCNIRDMTDRKVAARTVNVGRTIGFIVIFTLAALGVLEIFEYILDRYISEAAAVGLRIALGTVVIVVVAFFALKRQESSHRGTLEEIRNRKQAEGELQVSEGRYWTLFERAPDGIIMASPESYYIDANPSMCTMLGYTGEELIGLHASDIVTPEEVEHLGTALTAIKTNSEYRREWQFRRKNGSIFTGEMMATIMPDGNLLAMIRDTTDRKRTESERRAISKIIEGGITTPNLEEFFKLVHRLIGKVVYAENCFVMLHDSATDMIRFELWVDKRDPKPEPRFRGKGFASYVLRTGTALLLTKQAKGNLQELGEVEQIGSDSTSWMGVPLRTPLGTIGVLVLQHYETENVFSNHDLEFISLVGNQIALAIERKRAEEALRKSEEGYQDLVKNAIDIIYSHDLEGNYTSVNRAGETIMGYTLEEALKMNLVDVVAPEYREKATRMIEAKLAGEEVAPYELEVIAKDGRRVAIEINTRIMCENGVPISIQGIARDITERKLLEDQFRQAQKMESVGVLAGGIAHDFNNLLTVINGYSDLALRKMPSNEPLRPNIEQVREAGTRAAALTEQLLAFSRKKVLQPKVHNLNPLISDVDKMLRRIIRENIELRTVLDPELGNINADPGQIEQVIMNLAVNARDAMPNGGILTIETKNVYRDKDYVSQHIETTPGPFVKLTVTDTGEGMNEKTRQRIFEPFYTTKEVGKGTGLGLSTVYGIVKQSGGDIMVYSEIGHGTAFKIYLPCIDKAVEKQKWRGSGKEDLSGTETILLVEDEEIVRNLVREVLTSEGYTVLEAANGSEALSLCGTYLAPIHLLLTDMIMPGISGSKLKDQMVELLPDIRVLFMSGYTDDSISSNGMLDSDAAFIEKPFTPEFLNRKIREVLSS